MAKQHYMFDTNIISNIVKYPSSPLANRMVTLDREEFCTSVVVACELRYGVVKKGSLTLTKRVDQLLDCFDILPLTSKIEEHYAIIRVALESIGMPIGHNDLLIAAHARSLDFVLITDNVSEFSRVPDLRVENWLRN